MPLRVLVVGFLMCCSTAAVGQLDLGPAQIEPVRDAARYLEVSRLWEESDAYWHEGDFAGCIRVLKRIIELDPTDSEAYTNAGWLLESTNKPFEGFDMLVRNALANPRQAGPHFELGLKYYHLGCYDRAVEHLEKAVSYPCDPVTQKMLGHAYERQGKPEKAAAQFLIVLSENPQDPAALSNLIRILKHIPPAGDPTVFWHRPEPEPSDQTDQE